MDSAASVDTDLEILREQFKAYVDQLKKEWLQNNCSKSQDVFEVMNPTDRHEVERIITVEQIHRATCRSLVE